MRTLFYLFILILFSACGSRNVFLGEFRHFDLPVGEQIEGKIITHNVAGSVACYAVDSTMLFYTPLHPKFRVVACDRNTMQIRDTLIFVGRGPAEYSNPNLYSKVFAKSGESCVWMYAAERCEAVCLNVTRSLQEERNIIDTLISIRDFNTSLGDVRGQFVDFQVLNDSLAYCETVNESEQESRFIYNFLAKEVSVNLDSFYAPVENLYIMSAIVAFSPDNKYMARSLSVFNQIDICELDGGGAYSISELDRPKNYLELDHYTPEDVSVASSKGMIVADMTSTQDRLVVLRYDFELNKSEILIFDWAGKLHHRLLPVTPFTAFSLSDDGLLYGFVSDEELCVIPFNNYLE